MTITLGELQERINRQSPYIRARYTSLEQKKDFLDSLIRFEVLAKEALPPRLDKDPEVVRTMKQVMIQKLMRDEFDAKVTADSIADDEMKKYYDANLADYVKPEEVRASAIILKNKAQADRVLLEAKGDAGKTNKGFRDLVDEVLAPTRRPSCAAAICATSTRQDKDLPAPVVKAAFALANTGDVSGVVDAGNGNFYILKQTGRRKSMTKTFDDAKPQIRNKLFRDKRLQAAEGLRRRACARRPRSRSTRRTSRRSGSTPRQPVDDGHGQRPRAATCRRADPAAGRRPPAAAPAARAEQPATWARRSNRWCASCSSSSCWSRRPPRRPPTSPPTRTPRRAARRSCVERVVAIVNDAIILRERARRAHVPVRGEAEQIADPSRAQAPAREARRARCSTRWSTRS